MLSQVSTYYSELCLHVSRWFVDLLKRMIAYRDVLGWMRVLTANT